MERQPVKPGLVRRIDVNGKEFISGEFSGVADLLLQKLCIFGSFHVLFQHIFKLHKDLVFQFFLFMSELPFDANLLQGKLLFDPFAFQFHLLFGSPPRICLMLRKGLFQGGGIFIEHLCTAASRIFHAEIQEML